MIQVSGYFYDATTQQRIGDTGNYTIACMAGYNYNIAEALVQMQILEEFADIQHWAATQYLLDSQSGPVGLNYSATLPDIGLGPIQVPITGTYSADSFSFDYNNVLYWLKIYYEGIYTRSGEAHDIRFCRSDNPDELYLEYNYQKYPMGLVINDGDSTGYIGNIKTFPSSESPSLGYAPNAFLFTYSTNVSDVNPESGTQFYIGCFNMDSTETVGSVYKGEYSSINTIGIENQNALLSHANDYIGKANSISWYKSNDGYGIYLFNNDPISPIYGYGPLSFQPQSLPDWNAEMSYSGGGGTVFEYGGINWIQRGSGQSQYTGTYESQVPLVAYSTYYQQYGFPECSQKILLELGVIVAVVPASSRSAIYTYLSYSIEPESEISPTDIPPVDEPTNPPQPDIQDPYYDPASDPKSPQYDPVKDPKSPSYDPSVPATPYQPITQQTIVYPAPIITPPTPIPAPETPATYVNTSRLFTIFTPTVSQLTDFANFLWASPTDIVPTFRKIVANPMDCVLGLMVIPQLSFTRQSRELNIGNIGTGITMDYAPSQFVDFDCGQIFLQEYYRSYLDYSPYTKVDIFLPFIGSRELSIDECMQKTIGVAYRFDLATGNCIAFIKVNGSVLYQFEGNCASHIPLSSADWGSTVKAVPTIAAAAIKAGGLIGGGPIGTLGVAAAASVMSMKERHPHTGSLSGSAGLMGVLYPYLIVTRPCQALPESQNSFTGYPSFITMSLSECSGYTEVEQVHLEHVPATGEELVEIERLLKEGVLF